MTWVGAPKAAYVHIPFCRRRCYYCDFPISVVGDRRYGGNSATITHYVEVLRQEIALTPTSGKPLESVFLGGGTPSLLTVDQVLAILTSLDQRFGIAATAEISMEIDPGTFDLAQLVGYRQIGVNRVSLGVQALQSELLVACGRSHSVDDIYTAVDLIHQANVKNYSLDLISGLPHQTLDDWHDSLQQAIALAPTHLSCYDLTIESGTPFSRQYKPGVTPLPSDDTTAAMYRLAQQVLTEAGYGHYEISNYAKPGYQCRHNRVYWENRPFYGFGMGATSYLAGDRLARPRKTREYYEWVAKKRLENGSWGWTVATGEAERGMPSSVLHSPVHTQHPAPDLLLDTLMLGLRLAEGLSLERLTAQFGRDTLEQIWKCLQPYYRKGWVELLDASGQMVRRASCLPTTGCIRFNDPEGFLFSNVILVDLFEAFE